MPQVLLKWTDEKFDITPFLKDSTREPFPHHFTPFGAIYATDCMKMLPLIKDRVVDTIFADPPFNLGKEYGKSSNDNLPEQHYVQWCREWLAE